MKKNKFEVVVDNSKNKKEKKPEKEKAEKTFQERFDDRGVDETPISELDIDLESMPKNVRRMVENDLKNVADSAESFDGLYGEKMKTLEDELQKLKNLTERKRLPIRAETIALKSISDIEKQVSMIGQYYDTTYGAFSEKYKMTFAVQKIRDTILKLMYKMIDSTSVLEDAISQAPDKQGS